MNKVKIAKLSYEATRSFSPLVVDYQNRSEKLLPLINDFPSIAAIKEQIKRKEKQPVNRAALIEVLAEQYRKQGIIIENSVVGGNLEKLKTDNTFTICTAHQPNIFTGYLYFIYKIVHAINLAKECETQLPGYNFVPVYFIGSEDNDIEEIGAFNFKSKKYQWTPNETGACGRFSTASLLEIRDDILAQFGDSEAEIRLKQQIEEAYNGTRTLTQATQYFVHALFAEYGLIVLDADDKRLKQSFQGIIADELDNHSSHRIVSEHNIELAKSYKVQVDPRELNLFFMKDNIRERIEKDENGLNIVNLPTGQAGYDQNIDISCSIQTNPEYFSPNVILRPIYQECILPNVAFIGGGSEIAYWCELKSLFEYHNFAFPLLFVRSSLSIISNKLLNKVSSLGLEESFKPLENALKEKSVQHPAYIKFLADLESIQTSYQNATYGAAEINPNLKISAEAQLAKITKLHERLKTKYRAHIKREYEDLTNKKIEVWDALFPNRKIQERNENYLELVCRFKMELIPMLIEVQKPLAANFLILGI